MACTLKLTWRCLSERLDELWERQRRNIERNADHLTAIYQQLLRKARRGIKELRCDQGRGSSQRSPREEPEPRLCTQVAQGYARPSFVRSPLRGPREARVEGHDAYRVCIQRDDGPPLPRRAPSLDWLETAMPDGAGSPL